MSQKEFRWKGEQVALADDGFVDATRMARIEGQDLSYFMRRMAVQQFRSRLKKELEIGRTVPYF